jgi:5-methyltetrahydrofolate--homocysteine methyltransferase
MASLLYRPDFDAARDRLTAWWNGADIGRPAMLITGRRAEPWEQLPALPEPPGWVTDYSTSDFDYRVNLAVRACVATNYWGEAIPFVAPDLGPNCLALYLGCKGVDMPGTVWFEPCIENPRSARFALDRSNSYWKFTIHLAQAMLQLGAGKFLVQFPDLIEGLDTLAAMRGTEPLLIDLIERPVWVHECLSQITERYFEAYDALYSLIKDERGGSHFWAWAPGRMAKFQCDFSAMISPAMFAEFMVPVLSQLSERVDYCMYHWDGPGAIKHHDHLLSVPGITMIQWTPGAGVEPVAHPRWWPLYHRTVEAGKRVILLGARDGEELQALRQEFGPKLKSFMISIEAVSPQRAEEMLALVSD